MARPVKKQPEQWKKEILDAAKELFLSKGYEETAIADYPRKLFPRHSAGFTGFLDSQSYRREIEVKMIVPFVH